MFTWVVAAWHDWTVGVGPPTGRATGELVITLMQAALNSTVQRPVGAEEKLAVAEPLPPPMIPGNHASLTDKCFIGLHFTQTVSSADGWNW